ncbi:sporulation protein [Candidatus Saccharibacteria bacterium]|nr:sporulation protein [Candidatus Saccharibacteria bacterium]
MGFFSKIKDNFTHGVKVKLTSPPSARKSDASIDIQIEISNTGKQLREINGYSVSLYAEVERNENSDDRHTERKDVIDSKIDEKFSLNPGESKIIDYQIPVNLEKYSIEHPEYKIDETVAKFSSVFSKLGNTFGNDNGWEYYVSARFDVDGIALDPSDQNPIGFNDFGEFSSRYSLKL